jgi:phospholipid/cholesterol/gamma-HCH transport system substrate-binding protein
MINGLQVGKVSAMKEKDRELSGIIVTLNIAKDINIPKNSIVSMSSELLGTTAVEITLGSSPALAADGDTLTVMESQSIMSQLSKSINPAIDNANKALISVDSLIRKMSQIIDPATEANIQNTVANLAASSRSLERLINAQNGILVKSLNNVESITGNLAKNNEKVTNTIGNLEKTTEKFAAADIESVLTSMKNTLSKLETTIDNVSSKNGTVGMLLNDRQLYDEIRQTNRSLTTLLDDVRLHPKRYVSISVFGKKAKPEPLMAPIYDSTSTK